MWREGREDYQLVSAFFFLSRSIKLLSVQVYFYIHFVDTHLHARTIYIYIYISHTCCCFL